MNLPPMLFMKLLADRKLNPGGIELDVGAGDMNALLPLIAEDSFSALASAFPRSCCKLCWIRGAECCRKK